MSGEIVRETREPSRFRNLPTSPAIYSRRALYSFSQFLSSPTARSVSEDSCRVYVRARARLRRGCVRASFTIDLYRVRAFGLDREKRIVRIEGVSAERKGERVAEESEKKSRPRCNTLAGSLNSWARTGRGRDKLRISVDMNYRRARTVMTDFCGLDEIADSFLRLGFIVPTNRGKNARLRGIRRFLFS